MKAMQRKRNGLVPAAEVLSGLDGPVKAIRLERPPQRGFTLADQVHQLTGASEADVVGNPPQWPGMLFYGVLATAC